jgi:hypothetical protein
MSQNGPYPGQGWPAGTSPDSGEAYAAPADPWGDAADNPWGGRPASMPPEYPPRHPGAYPSPSDYAPPRPVPDDHETSGDHPDIDRTGYPPPVYSSFAPEAVPHEETAQAPEMLSGMPSAAPPPAPGSLPPLGMTPLGVPATSMQPLNAPPPWQPRPTPPPQKPRNGPIVALVVVLGLLICGGLGTTAYLVGRPDSSASGQKPSAAPSNQAAAPEVESSQDARFVGRGQCVRNEGNADDSPDLKIVSCTNGTFEVLKRVDGRTSGEADAESKCRKVPRYTKWYFYDSELDSLDFVLCLREYGSN